MTSSGPFAPRGPAAPALAALALALAACAGCTVDQAKEMAVYRDVLDAHIPADTPAPTADQPLTLEQALALANRLNEQLAITGEDYLQALIDKDRATAAFYPRIDLQPHHEALKHFFAPPPVGTFFPNPTTDVPINTQWNIFNGFRDLAAVEIADITAKYRRSLLLSLQAQTLLDTAQVYYQVLTLERQAQVLAGSVAVQDARVRDVQDRVKAGIARPLDLAQTEADAAATRTALTDARSKVVTARAGLALLIGVPSVRRPLVDEFEVPAVPSAEALLEVAYAHRPDLLAAEALGAAARKALLAAYAEYMPSVSVDFEYFLHKETFPPDSLWAFGVSVNIPLFHGGKIHAGVRRAYSLVRQAQYYESFTRRQVAEQVEVAAENLRASAEKLEHLQVRVRAAREAFGLADQSFDVGLATNLERLISQDRVLQAELALTAEALNHKILYINLVQAIGELVEEVGKLPGARVFPAPAEL